MVSLLNHIEEIWNILEIWSMINKQGLTNF